MELIRFSRWERKGNKQVLSDAAISPVIMAKSAIIGGIYNIRINLPNIKDEDFVSDLEKQIRNMEIEACILGVKILDKIKFWDFIENLKLEAKK